MLESRVAIGTVRHRRFMPRERTFSHTVVYFYLDLDRISSIFRIPVFFSTRPFSFFRFNRDVLLDGKAAREGKAAQDLGTAVKDRVENALAFRPAGKVFCLTQISYFGFGFNPVTFYYCFSLAGALEAIAAEITNTPWNERHTYVLDARHSRTQFTFDKIFHVSPFLDMHYENRWAFNLPGKNILIHMENFTRTEGRKEFDATLNLKTRPLGFFSVTRALLGNPLMTFKTHFLIYAHAGILWLRGFPFFSHPRKDIHK